ncbi:hypothetical protein SAMN05660964_01719 [Thiothrix caldifontis]|uniref:Uncharacterized protein n=1 Tax=Thiothrix caldifontis TaxID=525918 RepID=A0A1H4BMH7_9GAMM|nr:hypothetical protein [Thiothrix caldifontis]SEA49287.1 hypothetical protein SAMN05660964_01719 [Thiothrix caldifontis]
MMNHAEDLWPSAAYYQQVEQLRGLIGQPLYVVEIDSTEINAGVSFTGKPFVLLAIVDFPRPDPYRQLCPHLLVLDDGRGVNLGRVARISRERAFAPAAEDIVFSNQEFVENVLFAPRKLSRALVAATSRLALGEMLGKQPDTLLEKM